MGGSAIGETWSEARSRLLACALTAEPRSFNARTFPGESLSVLFHRASGHTHVVNEAVVEVLTEVADGRLHPVRQLAERRDRRSVDTLLQTVISLIDKGLADLVPLDSGPAREDTAGNAG